MDPSDTLADSSRRGPIRLGTVLLLVLILMLGSVLIERQRREARLREALAAYRNRSQRQIASILGTRWYGIDWSEGTTLEYAIELIKSRTATSWSKGIPIFVDVDALRRAGKTLKSPVKALPPDTEGKWTFRQKLRSVLEPMGLAFEVKDGAIMITTPEAIENPEIDTPEDEGISP
ncbi:MAG: hypothetical protein ACLQGP_19030 [Isosphaeraceae bacterium]